ncbi:class I SAM-dependent rRNA methyltransferase [Desulfofundulus thermocisternus]|uniref:class I SAM-dependent rRNA methyltransferase n=1 Tax=Desulfofundulus thermocisternus TaxID=42471 RepID=UPI0019E6DD38|nr:class I SAM-dependent rRNA methyltransferase [Desulfofundulus thermocisternus]MBE3585172.1 class I SAM-dependent rRNA methyltransferase [Thermoanaerobacter sp.]MCS5696014.1 class I SAM-dependent rRNA methyltransferase [Desulfofundulus thermocisternus]
MAVVKLTRRRYHRVLLGHPWVYRTEVEDIQGDFNPGDVVEVVDYRGRFVGRGYINPASQIIVRLLTREKGEKIDREFFRRRLMSAIDYRRRVVRHSNACRLVFAEADFLPALIVDRFGDYLSLQTLALGIDLYKETIVELLDELLNPAGIYERNDVSVRELEGLPLRTGFLKGPFNPVVEIEENGLRFLVDLAGGQKTGYFLDQRENRLALEGLARNARVLDCFCHTGTFSVYAARFGAREVLGIDVAGDALEMARENAARNGFDRVCTFREGNAFDELRDLDRAGERFDLIILDPPAFTKSREALEGAIRGYKEINLRAMKLLPAGGFLVTCSCSYHMTESLFMEVLLDAARDVKRQLRLVEMRRQARDHPMLLASPETYYLKCFILQVW